MQSDNANDRPQWGEVVHVDGVEYVVTCLSLDGLDVDASDKGGNSHVILVQDLDEYRSRIITIGNREVPEPVREPLQYFEECYVVCLSHQSSYYSTRWRDTLADGIWLNRGLIHRTESAARQHAEALIAVSGGEV